MIILLLQIKQKSKKSSNTWDYLTHFSSQARKNKTIHPEKNFLYFKKWNFLAIILKKYYIFSKERFSYICRNGPLYFSSQAQKIRKIWSQEISHTPGKRSFPALILKHFLYFRKQKPQKNFFYFLKRMLFLYFRKWKPQKGAFISGETSKAPKTKIVDIFTRKSYEKFFSKALQDDIFHHFYKLSQTVLLLFKNNESFLLCEIFFQP